MKEKMNFDVVVGNPPYKGNFHLKFLKIAYNISKEWVIWVHPSNWIVNRKGAVPEYQEMKNLIKGNLKEISFFNGNPIFNVDLVSAFGILVINKEEIFNKIKIEDKIRNIKISIRDWAQRWVEGRKGQGGKTIIQRTISNCEKSRNC